ncbi:MAG TPA: glycosyltransferase family 2 protein [Dehalococcoidia bacterium]|nr:glycosyltransferase family 2 protein [Dehalococcoidia bacterium]
MPPFVSVVVLNWDGKHFLEGCLGSLARQTYPDFEVILVDNGSRDGSVEYVQECYPGVRVIALGTNTGFCVGNNHGIRAARGDAIALLNNDTEVVPGWLAAQVEALEASPSAGSVASQMVFFDRRDLLDTAGNLFSTAGKGDKIGHREPAVRYDARREVFGFCAGACLIRREVLDDVGLLDEDFSPIYYEDVDLNFRAQLAGYRCVYEPGAIVYHRVSAAFGARSDYWYYLSNRNLEYVYVKNMPAPLFWRYGVEHLAYDALGLVYHAYRGHGRAVARAKRDALRSLPKMIAKRRDIQARRRVPAARIEAILDCGWHVDNIGRTGLAEWQRARRWVGGRLGFGPAGGTG